ncbi:MAG: Intracellular distribution of mitochondria [Vezdaea aestivalis]|nr:MAG: Intracellular distribution of mitochondria [Vezdaea aestivalis]
MDDPPTDNHKSTDEVDKAVETRENEQEGPENIFQLTIRLPHEPDSVQITVSTNEQMQDIRQILVELPGTAQYSCFHLEHNGERLNDFLELSEIKNLSSDPTFTLVEDPYTEKDARLHIVKVRELIGIEGDRTDLVQGLCAGVSILDLVASQDATERKAFSQGGQSGHAMSDFDLDAPGSICNLPSLPRRSPPKTVKSLALSPWNPPPYNLRSKGHLLYLQVTTNEGEQHQITGHIGGFFVSKSSNSKFDPFPRPSPKGFSAHSLLVLIDKISPSFTASVESLHESRNSLDALSTYQLTNAIPVSPWFVSNIQTALSCHQSDLGRSQESYLMSGGEEAETLRDWNEEFQTMRELPTETVQERVFRERLTSKLFADYTDASARGAVLIARGEVSPLNPTEDENAQIFVYNNIFFSYGADGVGTFASEGGDEAARAATGRDVAGVRAISQLDVKGIFSPGTVVVDYLGRRIVCQSIVPGIFKQRAPDEHQIDYGAVDGPGVVAADDDFNAPFKAISEALKIKPHDVWDKEGKKHHLQGSVETKGLKGTDGRKYILDLYRLTPLDICWVDEYWKEVLPENDSTGSSDLSSRKEAYPHRMTVLRMELVQDLHRIKAFEFIASQQGKIRQDKSLTTSSPQANGEVDTKQLSGSGKLDGDEDNQLKERNATPVEGKPSEESLDMKGFSYSLNGDAFTGQSPKSKEDLATWAKDEHDVREACEFLRNTVIPRLIYDLKEAEVGFPMDGMSLSRLLHKRGINLRYLGRIATLCADGGARLNALRGLCIQEMVARSFKHLSFGHLRPLPSYLVPSCVSHMLNCLLGLGFNSDPKPEVEDHFSAVFGSPNYTFEQLNPKRMQSDILQEVRRRFAFHLDVESLLSVRKGPLLREISLKIGLQLETKDYTFSSHTKSQTDLNAPTNGILSAIQQVNGHSTNSKKKKKGGDRDSPASSVASMPLRAPTTFTPDDIVNICPVIKDATPKSSLAEEAFEAGKFSLSQQQKDLGSELLLESLTLHEQIYGILHPEVARFYVNLSMIYYQLDDKAAAAEFARKAVIVSERTLGIDSAETVLSYLNLGLYEHSNGNTSQALAYFRHALDMVKVIYGPKHPDSMTTTNNVAVMLQHMKFYHDSRVWFEISLKMSEEMFGKDSENTATLLFQLAQALVLDGDSKGSVTCIRDAYNIFVAKLGPDDRNTKEAESWLEKLTQNAVSVAKHAKDLQTRKLRRVQLTSRVALGARAQPLIGQTLTDINPIVASAASSAIGGLDSRNIEELMRFIEGGEASKRQLSKKKPGHSNPKRRGGSTTNVETQHEVTEHGQNTDFFELSMHLPRHWGPAAHRLSLDRTFSVLNRPASAYPGHVPLNGFERVALAAGSAVGALINPRRADLIAALGEATAQPYFITRLRDTLLSNPTGRRILRDRPRITSSTLSLPALRKLPPTSLGATYAAWLDREGVSPDTRDSVRYIDNEEEAYVMQRYRESHDFYHALTGLPVMVEGEVALKAWEWANFGLPMAALSVFAVVRLKPAERVRFWTTYGPWAIRNGWRAQSVINVYWEEELETDVNVLRERLGLEQPPDLRSIRKQILDERRKAKETAGSAKSSKLMKTPI